MTGGRDWDLLGPQFPWGGRDRESSGQGSLRGWDLPHGALVTLCTSVELSKNTRNEVMVTLKRLIYYCMYAKWKNTTDNQPVRSQELLKSRQLATISTNHRQNKCTELFLLLCAFGFFAKQKKKERLIDTYCIIWLQNYEIYRDVLELSAGPPEQSESFKIKVPARGIPD